MNNTKTWDKRHLDVGSTTNFVTNSSLDELRKWHQLPIITNQKVLEIGIGYGKTVKQLKARNNTVYACDISQVAIDKVKNDCDGIFLTENLSDIEPVDLAISHLTFQHNAEHEVHRMIDQVNLKEDGVASFQFASLNPTKTVLSELIINDINKSMLYFYSCEKFTSIVDATDKEVIEFVGPYWFDSPFSFEWYVCKIRPKQ